MSGMKAFTSSGQMIEMAGQGSAHVAKLYSFQKRWGDVGEDGFSHIVIIMEFDALFGCLHKVVFL